MGYKILKEGELIKIGDEYYTFGDWKSVPEQWNNLVVSYNDDNSFSRLKIQVRREVVSTNIGEILKSYLKDNGYDGLTTEECGCGIDELFVCGEICLHCKPAHKRIEINCNECHNSFCNNYGLVENIDESLRGDGCVCYFCDSEETNEHK